MTLLHAPLEVIENVPLARRTTPRPLGLLAGQVTVEDDFDDPLPNVFLNRDVCHVGDPLLLKPRRLAALVCGRGANDQSNSAIGRPYGKIGIGRPVWSRNAV